MTGLLVSVRSAAEAEIALAGGADLIDVKEPRRGSLGATDPNAWDEVRRAVAGRAPLSVALGELLGDFEPEHLPRTAGASFAKMGLAGCAAASDWQLRWTSAMKALPPGVQPVAVAYADWHTAQSPRADELLSLAASAQAPYLLIDTHDKSAGNLLAYLPLQELAELSRRAAERGIQLVLAGSLDEAAITLLAPLRPAYFAVRGAASSGDRTQAIELARVKRLAEVVRTSVAAPENKVA